MNCKPFFLLAAMILTSGCSTMLPYKDNFDCPQMESGRCVSVSDAHSSALNGQTGERSRLVYEKAPGLTAAMEAYRKAVVSGKQSEIEKRQAELLHIISPGQASEFTAALEAYKQAIKKNEVGSISDAETKLHQIHASAVVSARENAWLESDMLTEKTRQEYLGMYAQGAKTGAVLAPPIVMEAHILPFQTDFGTLASERTLWITVEEATWVWPNQGGRKVTHDVGASSRGR